MTTIKDIAKIAGVSHTTVSRALNDSALISEPTKNKIKQIAIENNYVVNTSAKSLKLQRSFNIGIFFSTFDKGTSSSFFYSAIIGANQAVGNVYNLVVRDTASGKKSDELKKHQFDGIVLISQSEKDNTFIKATVDKGIPIVVVNRKVNIDNVSSFLSDDLSGSYKAVEYCVKQGHKEIAVIMGNSEFKNTTIRFQGYKDALASAEIPVVDYYIQSGDYTFKSGYEAMKKLLDLRQRPTAVFCFNDEMAIGAIKACTEREVKVPDEISIIGYDESEMSQYSAPALTTVARHIDRITKEATQNLIHIIENKNNTKQVVYYDSELIIRDSVLKI